MVPKETGHFGTTVSALCVIYQTIGLVQPNISFLGIAEIYRYEAQIRFFLNKKTKLWINQKNRNFYLLV